MVDEITQERLVQLSPLVQRITQRNPGLLTGEGTNTYLIGTASVLILDPGADTDEHFDEVLSALASRPVYAIVPTHAHPDHWPLARRLALEVDAVTIGFAAHGEFTPGRLISDRHILQEEEWTLHAIHTPGHSRDHMCYYLREERALFSGDHVMGWATTVLPHPEGNLNSYMSSLERLRSIPMDVMYPAHGSPIVEAVERIDELIAHRRMRTEQVLQTIQSGSDSIPEIVAHVYRDVDPRLHPSAQFSVLAHVDALLGAGLITVRKRHEDPLRSKYSLNS